MSAPDKSKQTRTEDKLVSDEVLSFLKLNNLRLVKNPTSDFCEKIEPPTPEPPPLTQRELLAEDLLIQALQALDKHDHIAAQKLDFKRGKIFPYIPKQLSRIRHFVVEKIPQSEPLNPDDILSEYGALRLVKELKEFENDDLYTLWTGAPKYPQQAYPGSFWDFCERLQNYLFNK